MIREVFPHGAVELESGDHTWKVNGHRLKPYIGGPIPSDEEVMLLESRAGWGFGLWPNLYIVYIVLF